MEIKKNENKTVSPIFYGLWGEGGSGLRAERSKLAFDLVMNLSLKIPPFPCPGEK